MGWNGSENDSLRSAGSTIANVACVREYTTHCGKYCRGRDKVILTLPRADILSTEMESSEVYSGNPLLAFQTSARPPRCGLESAPQDQGPLSRPGHFGCAFGGNR